MKTLLVFLGILGMGMNVNAQKLKPVAKVETVNIDYNGRKVKARKLTVYTEIPIGIGTAWDNVKTPALLQFVAKGMIKFKYVDGPFPKQWEVGKTYSVKMRVFGFIPFGGIHYLSIEKIDDANFKISTKEWDKGAKVWNHDIMMRDLGGGKIYYEDSITIYGGMMTGFLTSFAKKFYKHRQKRWQIVAENKLEFGY
jgi:hypothetical protein